MGVRWTCCDKEATGAGAKGAWPLERRPYIASKNPLGRHRFSGQGADPSDICYLCNSYLFIRLIAFRTRSCLNYGNSCTLDLNFGINSESRAVRLARLIRLICALGYHVNSSKVKSPTVNSSIVNSSAANYMVKSSTEPTRLLNQLVY